ncbi:ABC transporter substrate-binding protein [Siccirubricoccus phaeus]|uniref:ABC transporter substrate-binding protein n=1 Tax=Siccirubricoccus phaeus TaxID=2595053 RepID=UPI0011F0D51C|nr:ABC transporter substrate-binding protein [Siccirubricoccus phaeus]
MHRRTLLTASAAGLAGLAAPRTGRSQAQETLIFNPGSDVTILDPVWTTAFGARYLAMLSYDTLYGVDNALNPQPQMVDGHVVEDDGRRWRLTLREGLRFHNNEPVLARDAVASIRRWGSRDAFGQVLMEAVTELTAPSDREIVFRLRQPFPLLPNALAKSTSYVPVIMPAWLIAAPEKQVTEVMGSGPYRYLAGERVSGVRSAWERFEGYVPRPGGEAEFTSGPKIPRLKRVEFTIIPDAQTGIGALMNGEIDWQAEVLLDHVPQLRRAPQIALAAVNRTGNMGIMRFNHLHPPFDNPAIRRALLGAIDQAEMAQAVAGNDPSLWNGKVGMFCPQSPNASDAGMEVLTGPRDYARVKRDLAAAGYRGEKVIYLSASDNYGMSQQDLVGADQMRRAGMTVEIAAVDFGTWLQRRANRNPPERGGWNVTDTYLPGLELWDPATHLALRGNGLAAWPGWPDSPALERLRAEWFTAPDAAARQAVCRRMQLQAWQDVPYIPTCQWQAISAYRRNLTGMLQGMPLFYNLAKG